MRNFCKNALQLILLSILLLVPTGAQEATTVETLETLLKARLEKFEGESGAWRGSYKEIPVMILTDPTHNRMRIMTPIKELNDPPEPQDMQRCMEANFASALDARYAFYRGYLWSVYVHPLNSLAESDLDSALSQVVTLAVTHGSEYSSGEAEFKLQPRQPEDDSSDGEIGYIGGST